MGCGVFETNSQLCLWARTRAFILCLNSMEGFVALGHLEA